MKARYDVYERLRDLRGLSDYKVAEATGIPRSTFSDWRTGRSAPDIEKILKLVRFFEVNYYDFFGEEASRTMFENRKPVTDAEYQIIVALRQHPEMYDAVCKLLEIQKGKEVSADLA